MTNRILVIDDEEGIRFSFKRFLKAEGHEVVTAESYVSALERLDEYEFDLVFTDIILNGKTGIDILKEIRKRALQCQVVVFTGVPTIENATEAVRLGAFDYIEKPVRQETLLHAAKAALRHKMKLDEKERYSANLETIFKSVEDAIITVDQDMSIIEVNSAMEKICHIFRREAVGKPLTSLIKACSGECLEVFEKTIREKKTTQANNIQCRVKRRPEQTVSVTASPLIEAVTAGAGGVMVIKDTTRHSDSERHLSDQNRYYHIIGKSPDMQGIYTRIKALANVRTTVLITGDSGTGKELVAEAIHFTGCRSHKPLVKVNCAALPETLLESELFGHVAGAFTGAIRDKVGRFQMADGGTIFLDEITEMSKTMQSSLLRVLQKMEFERLGDANTIQVDVRVLAATNRNLRKEVDLGRFREDLYYRLKVIGIALPMLKYRREDIPLLAEHFLEKYNQKFNKNITGISEDVQEVFMTYSWPGNIRELMHAIEHAFVLCRGNLISLEHLPDDLKQFGSQTEKNDEYRDVMNALVQTRWNKTKAAELLGISRQGLYRKMKKYKILDN